MHLFRRLIPAVFIAAASFAVAGCASTAPGGLERISPGDTVEFDGSAYQVRVVEPEVGANPDPHACHLFPGARICLGEHPSGGMPTLVEAYSRSVVWCNGYGVYLRTGRFPF